LRGAVLLEKLCDDALFLGRGVIHSSRRIQ
jgi:hypothetical protein